MIKQQQGHLRGAVPASEPQQADAAASITPTAAKTASAPAEKPDLEASSP